MTTASARAYLGLGANLGDPVANLHEAARRLNGTDISVRRRARVVRSRAIGPIPQPDYANTVLEIDTTLTPHALLDHAKQIERDMGRVFGPRWGPRPIDIDILFFSDIIVSEPDLEIPHPEISARSFVLLPLSDLVDTVVVADKPFSVTAALEALGEGARSLETIDASIALFLSWA